MKKNIHFILRITFKIVIYFFAIIGFLTVFLPHADERENCADDGGVWDDEFQSCRFDCRTWQKERGCVMISDEELEDFVNDYCAHEGKGLYRCTQSALELSKRKFKNLHAK
ncbi:MAG: hypothetical protein IJS26_05165 [Alphaproteobacteria bacterium]|nr:hypothetical protein [Alphaproteobacteria bacterium]